MPRHGRGAAPAGRRPPACEKYFGGFLTMRDDNIQSPITFHVIHQDNRVFLTVVSLSDLTRLDQKMTESLHIITAVTPMIQAIGLNRVMSYQIEPSAATAENLHSCVQKWLDDYELRESETNGNVASYTYVRHT